MMAIVKIPFNTPPYRNVDLSTLPDQYSEDLYDGYIDEHSRTNKRPGMTLFADLGTGLPVDGIYWWDEQGVAIAVSGGKIFKILGSAGTFSDVTGDPLNAVYTVAGNSGTPVSFAVAPSSITSPGNQLIMANGGRMVTLGTSGNTAYMAAALAPTAVTFVQYMDGFVLANESGTGRFHISDGISPLTWPGTSFTVKGRPDILMAISVAYREILLVGRETSEMWFNDNVNPFRLIDGAFIEMGTQAPYTVQWFNNTWYWLNERRQLVRLEGRHPKIISSPFQREFDAITDVSSAFAHVMHVSGMYFYVITFPEVDKTYVYEFGKNEWQGRWGYWNQSNSNYERWRVSAYAFCKSWNIHLVGDKASGKLYTLDRAVYTDNGDKIRTLRRTGHISHGTLHRKRSNEITLRMKCGEGAANLMLRWRDNNKDWSNEKWLSLKPIGNTNFITFLKRNGMYNARQYELVHSDNSDFILIDAEEDVEALTRTR